MQKNLDFFAKNILKLLRFQLGEEENRSDQAANRYIY